MIGALVCGVLFIGAGVSGSPLDRTTTATDKSIDEPPKLLSNTTWHNSHEITTPNPKCINLSYCPSLEQLKYVFDSNPAQTALSESVEPPEEAPENSTRNKTGKTNSHLIFEISRTSNIDTGDRFLPSDVSRIIVDNDIHQRNNTQKNNASSKHIISSFLILMVTSLCIFPHHLGI